MIRAPTGSISQTDAALRQDWRTIATPADRQRIRNWYTAWQHGLSQARAGGSGAQIDAEGALLEPMAAIADPLPPAGNYACRIIKLGSQGTGPSFVAYPRFHCRVRDNGVTRGFAKLNGSQRPNGVIYSDTATRAILLGTLALGDEPGLIDYGVDAQRNVAGVVERIGPLRWRIVLPQPAFESVIDVMELVPER